jgi:hypothetical protein
MSKLQDQFDKLLEEQADLTKRFQEKAQELFKETTKEFFDKNPAVTAVIWTQYTPYFNDGDTCEFSVHEPYFTNATDEQFEDIARHGEYDGDEEGVWSESDWILCGDSEYCVNRRKEMNMEGVDPQSIAKFSRLIQSSEMEDVMEAMFGDHVRIVATRNGFDVDDCDHD